MPIIIAVLIVTVLGLIAGLGLSLASKFMDVPTDEKEAEIRACLPGANCGACGYSGCDGYAAALNSGEATPDKCSPGGEDTAKALSQILGVEVKAAAPMIAHICCNGNAENTAQKHNYTGMKSCTAASLVNISPLACNFGCIGFGDCAAACPFGAITVNDGKPTVCEELCVACGKCTAACPKGLISLIPKNAPVLIGCSNKAKGAYVVKSCKVSCIGCGLCERNCPTGAVKVVDNCVTIDYSLCSGCGKCKEACKRNVLV